MRIKSMQLSYQMQDDKTVKAILKSEIELDYGDVAHARAVLTFPMLNHIAYEAACEAGGLEEWLEQVFPAK